MMDCAFMTEFFDWILERIGGINGGGVQEAHMELAVSLEVHAKYGKW